MSERSEKKRAEKERRKKADSLLEAYEFGRKYAKGYSEAGASYNKRALKGFIAQSGAPSEDIDNNNYTLRQRGRMLYMASPIATGAINVNRTKIVGSGLRMKAAANHEVLGISEEAAQAWNKNTEAEWRMWCERKTCDSAELNNFYELQQIALKSWMMSGDVFAVITRDEPDNTNPYTMRLKLIEADRISTPSECLGSIYTNSTQGKNKENGNTIYDGVEVNGNGKVVAYHICNGYPSNVASNKLKWVRVEAKGEKTGLPNVIHCMDAERPEQYRGVTYLAPVVELLLQLRRYTESEITAALIQSYFTAWITTQSDTTEFPFGDEIEQPEVSTDDTEYEMGPGLINHLAPGEDIKMGNPNMPIAGYGDFVKEVVKQIGAALEIPYDVLIKEFNASYSAAKGALEEAWEVFKMRRSWFVNDFCQPIYEAWLTEAVASGRIKAPGFFTDPKIRAAYCGARWDGPAQTHLDPVKEANAAVIQVAHGWKTNEQVTRELYGENWHDNVTALREEVEQFKTAMPDIVEEEP